MDGGRSRRSFFSPSVQQAPGHPLCRWQPRFGCGSRCGRVSQSGVGAVSAGLQDCLARSRRAGETNGGLPAGRRWRR